MKAMFHCQPCRLILAILSLLAVGATSALAEEPEADSPSLLHDRLEAGAQISFYCNYEIWRRTSPTRGEWVAKGGTGTLDVRLTGNTLSLTNKTVSDAMSSAYWAPAEWTFELDASGSASYAGFWNQSVSVLPASLTLKYSYSSSSAGVRSSCIGFVH